MNSVGSFSFVSWKSHKIFLIKPHSKVSQLFFLFFSFFYLFSHEKMPWPWSGGSSPVVTSSEPNFDMSSSVVTWCGGCGCLLLSLCVCVCAGPSAGVISEWSDGVA